MKKILSAIFICILAISLISCGGQKEAKELPIDRTVEATAKYLDLKGGEETLYQMIHAKDGKAYEDSNIEIYLFESADDENYKDIVNGQGFIDGTAFKDGIVIRFVDDYKNDNLLKKFEAVKYK